MTSVYEHDPHPVKLYRRTKNELPTSKLSKVIVLQTDGQTDLHTSNVGKWRPASAGKEKAGMVHSVSGWMWDSQVKLWDRFRTRAIPKCLRGVFMTRHYTNPRLRLPYLHMPIHNCWSKTLTLNWWTKSIAARAPFSYPRSLTSTSSVVCGRQSSWPNSFSLIFSSTYTWQVIGLT